MHSTNDLEDGYLGSGKRLKRSIKKYGEENHKIEILEFQSDRESLAKREHEIVNQELLNDSFCMNLIIGGIGGGGFPNIPGQQLGGDNFKNANKFWLENKELKSKILSEVIKKSWESEEYREKQKSNKRFSGQKHSEEVKQRIGESNSNKQKGINNSQYGTCWITNGIQNKKIHRGDLIPQGWELGRK